MLFIQPRPFGTPILTKNAFIFQFLQLNIRSVIVWGDLFGGKTDFILMERRLFLLFKPLKNKNVDKRWVSAFMCEII